MDDIGKLLVGFAFNIEQRKGKYASMSRLINNLEMAREQGEQAKTKDSMGDKLAAFLDGATKQSKETDEAIGNIVNTLDKINARLDAAKL